MRCAIQIDVLPFFLPLPFTCRIQCQCQMSKTFIGGATVYCLLRTLFGCLSHSICSESGKVQLPVAEKPPRDVVFPLVNVLLTSGGAS